MAAKLTLEPLHATICLVTLQAISFFVAHRGTPPSRERAVLRFS